MNEMLSADERTELGRVIRLNWISGIVGDEVFDRYRRVCESAWRLFDSDMAREFEIARLGIELVQALSIGMRAGEDCVRWIDRAQAAEKRVKELEEQLRDERLQAKDDAERFA